jgi:hypothetical protein
MKDEWTRCFPAIASGWADVDRASRKAAKKDRIRSVDAEDDMIAAIRAHHSSKETGVADEQKSRRAPPKVSRCHAQTFTKASNEPL